VADLKTKRKEKGKDELHTFCQNTKRDRGERYFERYYRNGSAPWFREIKMNRRDFVPINRMRAGHSSLKARLNRFHIVSTAECECGDGLQTEEHFFWDCKRYEDQAAFCLFQQIVRWRSLAGEISHGLVSKIFTDKASLCENTRLLSEPGGDFLQLHRREDVQPKVDV
jgi:hypothetical protein